MLEESISCHPADAANVHLVNIEDATREANRLVQKVKVRRIVFGVRVIATVQPTYSGAENEPKSPFSVRPGSATRSNQWSRISHELPHLW